MEPTHTQRYQDCLELFLRSRGANLTQIEREMRDLGYTDFHRRILYNRTENGHKRPGWIARYEWRALLRNAECGVRKKEHSFSMSNSPASKRNERSGPPAARNPNSALRTPHSSDFRAWLKSVSPNMNWDWPHIRYITDKLKAVTDGTCKRLMIFLPPRHGKSELVTVRYTAWRMTQNPSMNVILAGYNQQLANRFSRKIKHVLFDAATQSTNDTSAAMPCEGCCNAAGRQNAPVPALTANSKGPDARKIGQTDICSCGQNFKSQIENTQSQIPLYLPANSSRPRRINTSAEWENNAGGSVRAVGIGGGVTGFGANLIIIDDPIKSRAEAESEVRRKRIWEWYRDDLQTRLEPDAAVVLIQTRWHEDDLAGRLIEDAGEEGDQWEVINLPALSEPEASATGESPNLSEPQATGASTPSLKGTNSIAQGKAKGRDPGYGPDNRPLPEREQPSAAADIAPLQRANTDNAATLASFAHPRLLTLSPSATVPTDNTGSLIPQSAPRSPQSGDPLGRAPGVALCPERFDEAALERQQKKLGTYSFSALYQQRPVPAEGGIFKRAWFNRFVDKAPDGLKWKRGYDLAVSTKTAACYTASFRCAFDDNGNLYIDGGFRERLEYPDQKRYIIERVTQEPKTEHGIELAVHAQGLIQELRREPRVRAHMIRGVPVDADKTTRALTWSPRAEEGKLILVRGPWNDEFIDEVCSFPGGRFDDQIDAVSIAVSMFAKPGRKGHGF